MATTIRDVITNALMEMGTLAQGETPSAGDASFCLSKLNRMLDQWNARRLFAFNMVFTSYTLTPNLQPHTIGPSGATFTATVRPVRIENANLILNNVTPNVSLPLSIRDDDWWANVRVKGIATTIPTDLYYSADFPNGSLYLWPVPTAAYKLELETRIILAKTTLDTILSLPPGYEEALTMSLAESICPSFGKQADALLMKQAKDARAVIQGQNSAPGTLATVDAGIPSSRTAGAYFNYRNGQVI